MNREYREKVELINKQTKELSGIYRNAVKHLGISETEFWVWYTLINAQDEYTQHDIADMLSLPKQTVNTVITGMRIKKYAYLEAIPGTRNHKVVRLTEAGRKHGEEVILPITCAEAKAFEKISLEELSKVSEIFGKYIGIICEELYAGKEEADEKWSIKKKHLRKAIPEHT